MRYGGEDIQTVVVTWNLQQGEGEDRKHMGEGIPGSGEGDEQRKRMGRQEAGVMVASRASLNR
jgi:hypothetical protein